jgi:hypothetical protein
MAEQKPKCEFCKRDYDVQTIIKNRGNEDEIHFYCWTHHYLIKKFIDSIEIED